MAQQFTPADPATAELGEQVTLDLVARTRVIGSVVSIAHGILPWYFDGLEAELHQILQETSRQPAIQPPSTNRLTPVV